MLMAAHVLLPVPMLLIALAFRLEWRWARPLAVFLPVLIGIGFIATSFYMDRSIGDSWIYLCDRSRLYQFVAYFWDLQMGNMPGGVVFGLVVLILMALDAKKRRAQFNRTQRAA